MKGPQVLSRKGWLAVMVLLSALAFGCHREKPAPVPPVEPEPEVTFSVTVEPSPSEGVTVEPAGTDSAAGTTVEDTQGAGTDRDADGAEPAAPVKEPPPAPPEVKTPPPSEPAQSAPVVDDTVDPYPGGTTDVDKFDKDFDAEAGTTVDQAPAEAPAGDESAGGEPADSDQVDEDTPQDDSSIQIINPEPPPDEDSGSDIYQVTPEESP